jgi:hypothetical protein
MKPLRFLEARLEKRASHMPDEFLTNILTKELANQQARNRGSSFVEEFGGMNAPSMLEDYY